MIYHIRNKIRKRGVVPMKSKLLTVLSLLMVLTFLFSVPAFAEGTTIDVSPIEPGQISNGLKEMGKDLTGVGQSAAYPLFVIGMIAGVVLMLCGVFSSRLLGAGALSFVTSFIALVVLGDLNKATSIFTYVADTFRNYF